MDNHNNRNNDSPHRQRVDPPKDRLTHDFGFDHATQYKHIQQYYG